MTGFASLTESLEFNQADGPPVFVQVSCEAKTINSRFFEANIKLPSPLSAVETRILTIAKKSLLRGKLFCGINLSSNTISLEKASFSLPMVQQYLQVISELATRFKLEKEIQIADLLKLPGVLTLDRLNPNTDFENRIIEIVQKTFTLLNTSRVKEGANLALDLKQSIVNCRGIIDEVKAQNLATLKTLQEKVSALELRAQSHANDKVYEEELHEAKHTLDKSDVNEEIVRFSSHLASSLEAFDSNVMEKGKLLDFLCQELVREINTICSKSLVLKTVQLGVAAKVELEKIKEQVQNLV
jgi:uncharacterized protein (TIGR00255 family)